MLVYRSWISYILKIEAVLSSETSVKISTLRHIPEDGILYIHLPVNIHYTNTVAFKNTELCNKKFCEELVAYFLFIRHGSRRKWKD
jgi:hypothetical protein